MKVGNYVRTKYGISQYKEYDTTNAFKEKILCIPVRNGATGFFANIEDVIKSSPNIIDLIEAGDYVNGYKVYSIGETELSKGYVKVLIIEGYGRIANEDIKSIVTKEQFSSMEYKL